MGKNIVRRYAPLALLFGAIALSACHGGTPSSSKSSASKETGSSLPEHTQTEVEEYLSHLKTTSVGKHLYYHYLRYGNAASYYADWDVWAWPLSYEGYRFDWAGRTTAANRLTATGDANTDSFGGAYVDIDLTKNYDGGWNNATRTMGGHAMSFSQSDGSLVTTVGLQIVKSAARTSSSGFWANDGGNLFIKLSDYALANNDGTTSYHVFVIQDQVQSPSASPKVNIASPFANDDGTNVTYGNDSYKNVSWADKALSATSPLFLKGDSSKTYLTSGAGVGYQIMVSSFADSDGDGFGDIYGIDQKLDYLRALGVNVLWLTPIQLSDSYHGYDITNYKLVDPKFGSKVSPASITSSAVTSATALADYQQLIADANNKGMAVIMDLVLNHTSNSNDWFIKSAQLDPSYRGYYQWGNHNTQSAIKEDNYWYPYGDHPYSYYAKFGSAMPELNYSYQATRDAVIDIAKYWCSLGVNGFRMDAVKHIFLKDEVTTDKGDTIINDVSTSTEGETLDYSSNLTKNLNFWKEINSAVKSSYPNAFFVGENFDGHAYHVAPFYEGFDSLFDFYSYFNMTSSAAHGVNASIGKGIQAYDGYQSGTAYTTSADNTADKGLSNSTSAVKYTGNWNLASVMETGNKYRSGGTSPSNANGYSFINGAFTSNHDIARCINRVAGSGDAANGVASQGTIASADYDKYLKAATCAEIAELMLPGCTWIYYGDELGMTGNWQNKATSSTDGYADLAYRQPMKWKQDGQVGDGSFTTGYAVTGSGTAVKWDEVNSTSKVVDVASSANSDHFKAIQAFAKAKGTIPALVRGNYVAYDWGGNDNIFNIDRTLNGVTYKIVVNFSSSAVSSGNGFSGYSKVASYNGADNATGSIPAYSAILMKE